MPRVSIVIAVYNRVHLLPPAIRSVLEQSVRDLELIVVDDGSTEDVRAVTSAVADERLIYICQENQGATAAFNTGLHHARGQYVGYLGSDDWYLPDALQILLDTLDRCPNVGLASGGFIYVNKDGNVLRQAPIWNETPTLDSKAWLFGCPILLQTSLIRRTWIEKVGGFDLSIKTVQDWDLGLRLSLAGCAMRWVKKPVFCYRIHGDQMIDNAADFRDDVFRLLDNCFARPDVPGELRSHRARAYALAHLSSAVRLYWSGRTAEARDDLMRAIEMSPDVLEDRGRPIFDCIVGWAGHPLTSAPFSFVRETFERLPDEAGSVRARCREALGRVATERFFHAYAVRDWPSVRQMFWTAAAHDWTFLSNRGVWSILLRMLGSTVSTPRAGLVPERVPL